MAAELDFIVHVRETEFEGKLIILGPVFFLRSLKVDLLQELCVTGLFASPGAKVRLEALPIEGGFE